MAEDICNVGERGAELIQRLLAFCRRKLLRPVETECNKLLGSMHRLLRRTQQSDIEITTQLDPDLRAVDPANPFVRSDAVMSLQTLGYQIIPAVDGAEATQKLQTGTHRSVAHGYRDAARRQRLGTRRAGREAELARRLREA